MQKQIEEEHDGEVLDPCKLQHLPELWHVKNLLLRDFDDHFNVEELIFNGAVVNI